jgi:hypothetical protein
MKKMLLGMVIGIVVVVSTVFFWPKSSISASEMPDEGSEFTGTEMSDLDGLIDALNQAENTIKDEDLKRYYRLLIEEYQLENPATQDTDTALPDVNHIVRTAMSLPLKEAEKTIRDEEIADFYRKFLDDAGWEFEW